jgi:hypothetical protein
MSADKPKMNQGYIMFGIIRGNGRNMEQDEHRKNPKINFTLSSKRTKR